MGPDRTGARPVAPEEIRAFLTEVGKRYPQRAVLYLVVAGALLLLGHSRPTFDVDYIGTDIPNLRNDLERLIQDTADELHIDVEAVPLQEMIPGLTDAAGRHVSLGQFGNLTVYIFDPVSIALSKLDRGSESDLEDIVFLLKRQSVTLPLLEQALQEAIPGAGPFDLDPKQLRKKLGIVQQLLKG